jgi:nitrite reductase/ring-hydroxylating ferredoxin subunit
MFTRFRRSAEFCYAPRIRFVVCPAESFPPGTRKRVQIGRRAVAVFNVDGRYFALRDVCPHQGAPLSRGQVVRSISATRPGCYQWDPSSISVRCPWHGWEYDLATGQSWTGSSRVRTFPVSIESGDLLVAAIPAGEARIPGPYVAETVPVSVEDDYVVIHLDSERAA